MVYKARELILQDSSLFHVTWQCHNKKWLLRHEWAKRSYYDLLIRYKKNYSLNIYSYQLMENHVHLMGQVIALADFSAYFRSVNSMFARLTNMRLKRQGQCIMNRFKSTRIVDESHMLATIIYIDLNGVRAGRDTLPEQSKWSSYKCYAYGEVDSLITLAPIYENLGANAPERQQEYRHLVRAMSIANPPVSV